MQKGNKNNKSFIHGVNEALIESMKKDKKILCYGLGVTDPKGIFGSTKGLEDRFGSDRVFDMPTSENAMTGVAIGAALGGYKVVMTHQRLDFFLLAMDQLVNSAAKWFYMFGGKTPIPITIRLILGRGWGQGPTHSQNLQAWFAHIPGLKVIMPSTASDAKGMLTSAIFDPNPVLFLEHRWLHNSKGNIPDGYFEKPIDKARKVLVGNSITIVSMSYLTLEAVEAAKVLKRYDVKCEIIDLVTINPIDWQTIFKSVIKTGRLLVLDTGFTTGSVAGEIIAKLVLEKFHYLKIPPQRIAMPDIPEPTSYSLTKSLYNDSSDILKKVSEMLQIKINKEDFIRKAKDHDVPGDWFKGPF